MDDKGKMFVYSANVNEPVGKITRESILDNFDVPSVLWGIDGDWMVNFVDAKIPFYPTDHCGYIRVKNEKINSEYFSMVLEKEGIMVGFDRTNRASIERISACLTIIRKCFYRRYCNIGFFLLKIANGKLKEKEDMLFFYMIIMNILKQNWMIHS